MATCCDERHPPEAAIDGNPQEFWVTTGCFPQEIVIQLPHSVKAQLITVETINGTQKRCSSGLQRSLIGHNVGGDGCSKGIVF